MGVPSAADKADKSNLFRKLSSVLLINSQAFGRASPTEQTEVMANGGAGIAVLFVPTFVQLSNRKAIRDKLLAGKDVSVELEFNGIDLSDEDRRVLALVGPVLEKISDIDSSYPWLDFDEPPTSSCGETRVSRNGYTCSVRVAKTAWEIASAYWAGGDPPGSFSAKISGYNRMVEFGQDDIVFGCQRVTRGEAEAIARHYGWEPNIA